MAFPLLKLIVVSKAISSNLKSIGSICLCSSEGLGCDVSFDEDGVLNDDSCILVPEEVLAGEMVSTCGFHYEESSFRNAVVEIRESRKIHRDSPLRNLLAFIRDDSVIELFACDVNPAYCRHNGTSWVTINGSLNPISRLNEALRLNQPIGIKRDLEQTPVEALSLDEMLFLGPSIISNSALLYRAYY